MGMANILSGHRADQRAAKEENRREQRGKTTRRSEVT
jgi:hypothetical protein